MTSITHMFDLYLYLPLLQPSSSHKLEKLVAQTCPKVLAAMTSGFSPPIHHHSAPILDHLGSSWRPDFASRNSKFASSNFFSFFSKDSSESLDHSATVVGALTNLKCLEESS